MKKNSSEYRLWKKKNDEKNNRFKVDRSCAGDSVKPPC